MVCLNFYSHLGEQMGETAEQVIFRPNRFSITTVLGVGPGSGRTMAKNLLRHAREVGDHPIVIRLNFCGHLGRQTGEMARTGSFRAKLVYSCPRFLG